MAEAIFRDMVNQRGLGDKIFIDSCGTANYHTGKPPHDGTKAILASNGISCAGQKASTLGKHHLKEFDALIAMDEENLANILKLQDENSTAWVKLLSDFVDGEWVSVPDPWYTGDFQETYELVTDGCEKLLDYILEEKLWKRC